MRAWISVVCLAGAVSLVLRPWHVRPRPFEDRVTTPSGVAAVVIGGPWWGALVVAAWSVHPLATVLVGAAPTVRRWAEQRRTSTEHHHAVVRALPEVIDLISLCVVSGMGAREAVAATVQWQPAPFAGVFGEALRRSTAGEPFSESVDAAAPILGPEAQALCVVLGTADTAGGGLVADLHRLGDEARALRRSAAAERAQRLPVQMLAPLVLCVLPAFVLVAVVPLLLAAVSDFGL